jgi:hypothetical protein
MTEEQVKYWFNALYRYIALYETGASFDELVNWANKRNIDDDVFMSMLDKLEETKLVIRQGEIYMALELAKHQRQA